MKQITKLLAFAAVAGMAFTGLAGTNGWFTSIGFEGTTITSLTNAPSVALGGAWTTGDGDESIITDDDAFAGTWSLKLNTQGTDLTFTPNDPALTGMTETIIDAAIYFVGSETEPSGFDGSEDVQTAVFLKNFIDEEGAMVGVGETSNSVLYAYVGVPGSGNVWVPLDFGFNVVDTNWYELKIMINYEDSYAIPYFYLNGTPAAAGNYYIANYSDLALVKEVSTISFRGTGNVDNFAGYQVVPDVTPTFNYTIAAFLNGVSIAQGEVVGNANSISFGGTITINFAMEAYDSLDPNPIPLSAVYVNTGSGPLFLNPYATPSTNGPNDELILDENVNGYQFTFTGDTTGYLTDGWIIQFIYGVEPSPGGDIWYSPSIPLIIGGGYGGEPWPMGIIPLEIKNDTVYVRVMSAAPVITYELWEDVDNDIGTGFGFDTTCVSFTNGVPAGEIVELTAPVVIAPENKSFFKVRAEWPDVP